MKMQTIFWGLMILWLIFGLLTYWPEIVVNYRSFMPLGGNLVLWILLALLGWKVYGPMIQE